MKKIITLIFLLFSCISLTGCNKPDPSLAEGYMNRSKEFLVKGDIENALYFADQAIKKNPKHAEYYWRRGKIKSLLNDNQAAIEDMNKSIELGDKSPFPHCFKADCENVLKKPNDAKKDYEKCKEIAEEQNNQTMFRYANDRLNN